jgi:hypothetical protein
VDSFAIPTGAFDVSLLPEEGRVVGSPEFLAAVSRFFESQFLEMGVNGQVVVTPETIRVTWAQSGADPIEAGIEKLQRGQLKEDASGSKLCVFDSPTRRNCSKAWALG